MAESLFNMDYEDAKARHDKLAKEILSMIKNIIRTTIPNFPMRIMMNYAKN